MQPGRLLAVHAYPFPFPENRSSNLHKLALVVSCFPALTLVILGE